MGVPRRRPASRGPVAVLLDTASYPQPTALEQPPGGLPPATADTVPEEVLVELQLGRIVSRTVRAYRLGDEVLLPLGGLLDLAEIRAERLPAGRIEAELQPRRERLVADPRRDTLSLGGRRVGLAPGQRVVGPDDQYIASAALGELLGLRFVIDWPELTVMVGDPGELPVARRARREAARDATLRRRQGLPEGMLLAPDRRRWEGFVLDYSVLSPSSDVVGDAAYAVVVGADAFGGAFQAGVTSPAGGAARVEASWTGVWREQRWLRQLRLGDDLATGPRPRTHRGVAVTNAPYVRPSQVGSVDYLGVLPPGWEVEAYRGGELVAWDSVDASGRFGMTLPVHYGENPVDFIAYGPFGEVREFNRTYRVSPGLLPAGQLEYGVSAGGCRDLPCQATANADFRYGVSRRWTVQAGADRFWRDSLGDLSHPYASVLGSVTNAWAVELDAVANGFLHGGIRYEPSVNLRLAADYTRYDGDVRSPLIAPPERKSHWSLFGFLRPKPSAGFFFLEAGLDRITTLTGTHDAVRLGLSTQVREIRLLPYARIQRDAGAGGDAVTRSFVGLNAFVLPRPRLGPFLGRLWLRTTFEAEDVTRPVHGSVFAARPIGNGGSRIELGASWSRGTPGTTVTLALSSYLPFLRSTSTVTAPIGGEASAVQLVQGSLLWNQVARRFDFAPGPSLERAGIAGRVFLDLDANGKHDPGEPGVPDVRIRVGSATAVSDSSGRYGVWDIVPFEPVAVTVDSLSLSSPLWVPGVTSLVVSPGPNRFRRLDLPIALGGVIEGRVVRVVGGARRGLGGATLVLTDRRTGATRTLSTFTDGEFYAMGIVPGEYELAVAPRLLQALGARGAPVRFTLVPDPRGAAVSGLEVVVGDGP
ncbi:MAG TPA: hypothetical protein VNK43_08785 [Gemmatimonadales bacterium]|nr:hypothetical protein [Gemmatimonadales bacterium]